MKNEIEIKEIFILIKRRWRMIASIVTLFIALGILINLILSPAYEARVDLLVSHKSESNVSSGYETSDIETSLRLTETYSYMLKSDRMLNEVISKLEIPYEKAALINNISTESINNSPIITIIGREKSPEMATTISSTYATAFKEEIKSLMGLDNISILDTDSSDKEIREIKTSPILITIISILTGFSTAFMIMLIQEFYFTKINTVVKAEKALKVPNLGVLPTVKIKGKSIRRNRWEGKLVSNINSPLIFIEEFRRIRANLQYYISTKNKKTILITSPLSGDGKSMISSNLAITMAMGGQKTLFIDADLRTPVGRGLFNLPKRGGLTSLIAGHYNPKEIIQKTSTENLSFIGPGPIPPNPADVLSSREMVDLLITLKEQFDVIIIDTPPLIVADAISLSTVVDACIYVIDAKRTKEELANITLNQLKKVKAPILGTILNNSHALTKGITYEY